MTLNHKMQGFQKPLDSGKRRTVRLAVVTTEGHLARCSCGWVKFHSREKVREDAVDRHLLDAHGGAGIRL